MASVADLKVLEYELRPSSDEESAVVLRYEPIASRDGPFAWFVASARRRQGPICVATLPTCVAGIGIGAAVLLWSSQHQPICCQAGSNSLL